MQLSLREMYWGKKMESEHWCPVAVMLNTAFQLKDWVQWCDFGRTNSHAECHRHHHKFHIRLLTAAKKSGHAIFPFLFSGHSERKEFVLKPKNWLKCWTDLCFKKGWKDAAQTQLFNSHAQLNVCRRHLEVLRITIKLQKQIPTHNGVFRQERWRCKDRNSS